VRWFASLGSGALRWPPMVANYERDLADLRSRVSPDEMQQAWADGARWTAQEALAYALLGDKGLTEAARPPQPR
jgi:hypothetical protein